MTYPPFFFRPKTQRDKFRQAIVREGPPFLLEFWILTACSWTEVLQCLETVRIDVIGGHGIHKLLDLHRHSFNTHLAQLGRIHAAAKPGFVDDLLDLGEHEMLGALEPDDSIQGAETREAPLQDADRKSTNPRWPRAPLSWPSTPLQVPSPTSD